MESSSLRAERESRLVGKVCDLCRGLENDISVVLTVMSGLGIVTPQVSISCYVRRFIPISDAQ
jgi:hypothetical protein